ncbi:MAG: PDZ domain-containing protein [Verrucomicrobia bacterium]|nr:PDZ domain-containing protein [Verrucomicrobiota bacterium]
MKPIVHPILVALAFSVAAVSAEEIKKAEPASDQTEVKIGPISVSVETTTKEEASVNGKTAYLGVVTAPLSRQLRAQLDLPVGMGLSVEAVAKGSPADKAGIKQYDVLKKFNDQMLCAQEQLSVLVKAAGKDAKVELILLRGGKEQNMSVILGEHDAPESSKTQFSINGVPGMSIEVHDLDRMLKEGVPGGLLPDILGQAFGDGAGKRGSAGIQQNMEELRKKNEKRQKENEVQNDASEKNGASGSAKAQVFSFYPGGQSQSVVTIADTEGTVEINDSNGKRTVKVKDASGKEIHSGPLNTEADHEAIPEKFRAKVKDAEGKIKLPGADSLKKKQDKKADPQKTVGGAI